MLGRCVPGHKQTGKWEGGCCHGQSCELSRAQRHSSCQQHGGARGALSRLCLCQGGSRSSEAGAACRVRLAGVWGHSEPCSCALCGPRVCVLRQQSEKSPTRLVWKPGCWVFVPGVLAWGRPCPACSSPPSSVHWAQQNQLREAGHLQEPLSLWLPLPSSVSLLAPNFLLFGLPQPQQPFPSCLPLAPAAASFSSGLRPSPWFRGNKTELSRGVVLGVLQGGRKKPEGVRRPW